MASIQRIKNKRSGVGRFRYRVKYRDDDGRHVSRTFAEKTQADQFKLNLDKGIEVDTRQKYTFGEVADRFLEQGAKDLSDNTRAFYSSLIRTHLKPRFKSRQITKILLADVEDLRTDLERTLSASTTRGAMISLQRVLGYAESHKWVQSNVARGASKPGIRPSNKRILKPGEVSALLGAATPTYRMLFKLALATGARQGELLGLEWDAIADGYVHIRQQFSGGQITSKLKSKRSDRMIPIPPDIEKELRRWRLQTVRSKFVFPNEAGNPMNSSNVRNRGLIPALVKGKIERPEEISFHCFRHTYGSNLVNAGRPLAVVSKVMGHSSINVTVNIYHHASPESDQGLRDAVASMDLPDAVSL